MSTEPTWPTAQQVWAARREDPLATELDNPERLTLIEFTIAQCRKAWLAAAMAE